VRFRDSKKKKSARVFGITLMKLDLMHGNTYMCMLTRLKLWAG